MHRLYGIIVRSSDRFNIALLFVPAIAFLFVLWTYKNLRFFYTGLVDPSYAYYLNMVRVYSDFWPGIVEHPGLPPQMLGGLVLFLTSFFVQAPCPTVDCHVLYFLTNSETFIWIISLVFSIIFLVCFVIFGFTVHRISRQLHVALAAQIFFIAMPSTMLGLLPLAPEALLASLGLIVAAFLAPALATSGDSLRHPFGLGATVATAVFTKFTALPYALFLFLTGARRQTTLAVAGAVVLITLWLPLLINQFKIVAQFYTRFLLGSGRYGYIQIDVELTAFQAFLKSIKAMIISMPFEIGSVAVLAVAMIIAYFARRRIPLLIGLIVVASFLCLAVMFRQPLPRYFLPIIPLLALGVVWLMMELRPPARFPPLAALGVKLVPLAALGFVLVNNLQSAKSWVDGRVLNQRRMVAYEKDISQRGDCYLMRPRDQLTGLYFGTGWARSDLIRNVLTAEYGNFITYNHNGRRELYDFAGMLTAQEIQLKQRVLGKRLCAIFNNSWTVKLDESFYEVLERKRNLTAVRVRDPIVP